MADKFPRRSDLKVLVVDDDLETTEHIGAVLTGWGYEPRTATHGRMARETSRMWPPDVALLDLRLPDVDGFDLLRQLHAMTPTLESIVISGDAQLRAAVEAASCGALCFLEKPVSLLTLR